MILDEQRKECVGREGKSLGLVNEVLEGTVVSE